MMWRKVWVMATNLSPGTGNVGVSRLAAAQRPRDESNLADVVARAMALRARELGSSAGETNPATGGRGPFRLPSA